MDHPAKRHRLRPDSQLSLCEDGTALLRAGTRLIEVREGAGELVSVLAGSTEHTRLTSACPVQPGTGGDDAQAWIEKLRALDVLADESEAEEEDAAFVGLRHGDVTRTSAHQRPVDSISLLGGGALGRALRRETFSSVLASAIARGSGVEALVDAGRTLVVACSDFEDIPAFRSRNRDSVRDGAAALYVMVAGDRVQLGPWVLPGESGCYECYLMRLMARLPSRDARLLELQMNGRTIIGEQVSPLALRAAVSLVEPQLHQLCERGWSWIEPNTIYTLALERPEVERDTFMPVPFCPVCRTAEMPRRNPRA